jgi:hypothetical protein
MNAVIVKYDPSGTVLWAKTVYAATGADGKSASEFMDIQIDSSGNACVCGWIYGTRTYAFEAKVEAQTVAGGYEGVPGDSSTPSNALLAKFDSEGYALWTRSVGSGASNYTYFAELAIESSDSIYVAGTQYGNGTFAYGSANASEAGSFASGKNALVAKYDASGDAIWARTVASAPNKTYFGGIGVDGSGGVYAAGYQTGNGIFDYGDIRVDEPGSCASAINALIVKYDASSGAAIWARSVSAASSSSNYTCLAVDPAGNAYAAGQKYGNSSLAIGGKTATGTASATTNALIAAYDGSGNVRWAKSVESGAGMSCVYGTVADPSGSLFIAGAQESGETYTYGGLGVSGAYAADMNAVLVKLGK